MPFRLSLGDCIIATLGVLAIAKPLTGNEKAAPVHQISDVELVDEASALETRDEWQISPDGLQCLYMTNEANWAGEGENLCFTGGKCGMFSHHF